MIIKITYSSLTSPSSAFEYPQHSSTTLLSLSMGRDRWHNFPAKSPGGGGGGGPGVGGGGGGGGGGGATGVWEGLTCDHSLSLCLCNPSFFSKKQTSKKIIIMTPDLRLRRGL